MSDPSHCRVLAYRDGALRDDVSPSHIDQVVADQRTLVWVDAERPNAADLELLAEEFELHPLVLADIRTPQQRPKLDVYGGLRMLVLFDIQLSARRGRIALHEVDVFVGPNFLITVHHHPVPAIEELRTRWLQSPRLVEPNPLGFLLYQLLDGLVDHYFPVADALESRLELIEERLFQRFGKSVLRDIFGLRRELIELRRVLGPERDLVNLLLRREDPLVNRETYPYFADVLDLLLRVTDTVDTIRELQSAALESYLSVQSNQLNEIVKRMTALTVTLMIPTLIAGIYGMNFSVFPTLEWQYGFWLSIVMMVGSALGVLYAFRRGGWL